MTSRLFNSALNDKGIAQVYNCLLVKSTGSVTIGDGVVCIVSADYDITGYKYTAVSQYTAGCFMYHTKK